MQVKQKIIGRVLQVYIHSNGRLLGMSHSTIWEIEQGKIYKDIA